MSIEMEENNKPAQPVLRAGVKRFLSFSPEVRQRIIGNARRRAAEDAKYFKENGLTINDLPIGTILPSGNTIIVNENGSRLFRAPADPLIAPNN